jgi:hypothetical protein
MSKSTDQGVTFGAPVTVTTLRNRHTNGDLLLTDSSGRYFRSNAFPQAVVNPVTGDIYVAYDDWGDNSGKDRGSIYFTESTDGGRKWSKPVQVNDDQTTNDQWSPALAVTPDGSHVGLFWYDRRLDPGNNLIVRFGAIGTVSGHTVTFGANFRITDVSFPPAFGQDPLDPPYYVGDYDMATADNVYFYTTWGDNRLADAFHANQPDVRLAKVPVGWAGAVSAPAALAGPGGALASRPAVADSTPFVVPSGGTAPPDPTQVAALWTDMREQATAAGWAGDAYLLDLARTGRTTVIVPNGDPAPQPSFGLALPALPGTTGQVVPPSAWVSGTPTSSLARRAAHGPADGWATDALTSAGALWDGEAVPWAAR